MKQNKDFNHRFIAICLIIVFVFVFVYIYIQSLKERKADKKAMLEQQQKELEILNSNIDEAKGLKLTVIETKFWLRFLVRFISVCGLVILNYLYIIQTCEKFALKEITEAIINCNAGLVLTGSVFFFLLSGSFMELKRTYIKTELVIIAYFLDKKEKTIESLLAMHEINRETLLSQIAETQRAIAELEEIRIIDVNSFIQKDNPESITFTKQDQTETMKEEITK